MNKLTILVLLCLYGLLCSGQTPQPIIQTSGRLSFIIDPKVELLCTAQLLADYQAINRTTPYSKELLKYFENDTSYEAIKLTTRLSQDYGFNYDAPLDLMLRLSAFPDLKPTVSFPNRCIERAGSDENLEHYRLALKQFAGQSRFSSFWNSKKEDYQAILSRTIADLAGDNPVETITHYFNESRNSFSVVISPAFAGGYGIRVADSTGRTDLYGCLPPDQVKDGIPYLSRDWLLNYLYHEFSHSFINPLTDEHPKLVEAAAPLFSPIEPDMEAIHYGRWITCINEHIVRAVHIRILQTTGHEQDAENLLEKERMRRFVYIDPVIAKLRQFEQVRDAQNVTFTQFYPELLAVFDSLTHSDNLNLINPLFYGPVQTILGQKKVTIIYPTSGSDRQTLQQVYNYTEKIRQSKGPLARLLADTTALKTDLSDEWIMAYGSIESNLFLQAHKKSFPFSFSNDTLITNQKFIGENLRMITCVPNPANPRRGLLINTAVNNRNLKAVMIPAKADYLVFEEIDSILQQGFFNHENPQWTF